MVIDSAIEETCALFSNEFSRSGKYTANKCFNLLSKLIPVYLSYPHLFEGKQILDFGSGQGEHTFFLYHFGEKIYSFDPVKSNALTQFRIFYDFESIKVLRHESECYDKFDTFLAISLLHLIEDPANWIKAITSKVKANNYVFINSDHNEESLQVVDQTDYDILFNRQTTTFSKFTTDELFDTLITDFNIERFDFKDFLGLNRVALIINNKVD